ncbi:MAG: hypothetical protein Q4C96_02130 [Planctomycetia bacterium]|nr:hypothetical protein [Planctomycetia bacterium]
MKEILIALPAQNFESFSLRRNDADSHEILTAWTAVYHPDVLCKTRQLAQPFFVEYTYEELENKIFIVPYTSYHMLDENWIIRAKENGCIFLTECAELKKLVRQIKNACSWDESQRVTDEEILKKFSEGDSELSDNSEEENSKITETYAERMVGEEDFLALGMMHFLVEIFSRRMNYSSSVDEYEFKKHVLSALDAYLQENETEAEREIQFSWDQLIQSRQYYCPSDGTLFDLTLLTESVLSTTYSALEEEIKNTQALNILAEGATIRRVAEKYPSLLEAMKNALHQERISLLGGEEMESPLPLLTQEGILWRLLRGISVYKKYLNWRPGIYARRSFGLTPMLPGILKEVGYKGALHTTFDDGKFPVPPQKHLFWQGMGTEEIEVLATIPADAKNSGEILSLMETLEETLKTEYSQRFLFAHWPGNENVSFWYRLWKRSARYVPILGELSTFDKMIQNAVFSGQNGKFMPDEYVSPYLMHWVAEKRKDPISRWMRYHQLRVEAEALQSMESMRDWVTGKVSENFVVERLLDEMEETSECSSSWYAVTKTKIESLRKQYAQEIAAGIMGIPAIKEGGERENRTLKSYGAEKRRKRKESAEKKSAQKSENENAVLLLNPRNFVWRETVDLSAEEKKLSENSPGKKGVKLFPAEDSGICSSVWRDLETQTSAASVNIPPHGFSVITHSEKTEETVSSVKRQSWLRSLFNRPKETPVPVFKDTESNTWVMRNEFLELRFDPYTGYLRSVYDQIHRGNRLSQQIGMRLRSAPLNSMTDEDNEDYTIMAADDFHAEYDACKASLLVSGRLVDRQGVTAAKFHQHTILRRGESLIEFEITLDPIHLPEKNAWQSYYANRFVWADAVTELYRNVGVQAVKTSARKMEAPLFIDIRPIHVDVSTRAVNTVTKTVSRAFQKEKSFVLSDSESEGRRYGNGRITILTNGLPFHRFIGTRRMDNLLMVQGETQRNFRMAVALNTMYPIQEALKFMTPSVSVPVHYGAEFKKPKSGWVLSVDRKNVLVTHWHTTPDGAVLRLAETQGRGTTVRLSAYRDITRAVQTDFLGNVYRPLKINEGSAVLEMSAYAWIQMEIKF